MTWDRIVATLEAQKLGGAANAKTQRDEAIRRYYSNPNVCQNCCSVIGVNGKEKVREVRRKRFCSKSCAAKANNVGRVRANKKIYLCIVCGCECGTPKDNNKRSYCKKCYDNRFVGKKKSETSPRMLREHARRVYAARGVKACERCGYDKHVECCHIKPVSSFGPDALISAINNPENLVGLCPNCHWEFDHSRNEKKTSEAA